MQSSSPGRVGTGRTLAAAPLGGLLPGAVGGPGPPGRVTRARARGVLDGTMDGVTSETRSSVSPYTVFDRASWRALAAGSPKPLDEAGLRGLAPLGGRVDLDEGGPGYLPPPPPPHPHGAASPPPGGPPA